MPSNYAHYRIGQEVRDCLENEEKKIVEEYPELFLIGLHGPDVLFFIIRLYAIRLTGLGMECMIKPAKSFLQMLQK